MGKQGQSRTKKWNKELGRRGKYAKGNKKAGRARRRKNRRRK
jgi:hypothetical protein